MKRSLSLAALLTALVTSVATSQARYGTSDSVEVGSVVLSTDAPSVDLDLAITTSGASGHTRINIRLEGENPTTTSLDLVLVDLETGSEIDRVTVAGGFADEAATFNVSLDASELWAELVSVSLVLDGEGTVEGLLTVDAEIALDAQPAEGDEPSLELEVL